ncbi:histidine kinase [Hymenobacter sp. HMF4947]|uniref:histidine kinase n=1 Tax=Hymenobacter ginkgonis TaxID=2682976 RepID=A0A7K1THM1_9BACT|nr:ATP-binding protein [Hymenobacter ginkgonis]MVN77852.1 histidine kinase [Hymenobacter ginkgonis]
MNRYTNADLLLAIGVVMLLVQLVRRLLDVPQRLPRWNRLLSWLWAPAAVTFAITAVLHYKNTHLDDAYLLVAVGAIVATLLRLRHYRPARTLLLGLAPVVLQRFISVCLQLGGYQLLPPLTTLFKIFGSLDAYWFFAMVFLARSQKKALIKQEQLREKEEQERQLIAAQNAELERLVAERTAALTQQAAELNTALDELRTTQGQLIQSEKMASLGELTAGIAHEIQNPLNFVNNFADVSAELVAELEEEQARPTRDAGLEDELLRDLKHNLFKINQHGQRAASIVRGMLEHSRASTGERRLTDLNALADEYLRLAYHGLRAKDKTFNATLQTDFAPVLPLVEAVAPDVGRVLLNLFNNAFYAVQKRQQLGEAGYAPTVRVQTRRVGDDVEVRVRDNGTGIPEAVRTKVFQPFFTTKPSGEGTGLGLSLSHDIITKGHGGTLSVESCEGEFTEFCITLPF